MSFVFVSGNLALDLVGTKKWRRSDAEELLGEPTDFSRWLADTGEFPSDISVDAESFRLVVELREAVYRLASARLSGTQLESADLTVLNELAAQPGMRVALTANGVARSGDARAAIAEIARLAVAVLGETEASMKECGRPTCTRIYLDRSRGARRTWCGMDECGNRVKAAAYRARKRAEGDPGAGDDARVRAKSATAQSY